MNFTKTFTKLAFFNIIWILLLETFTISKIDAVAESLNIYIEPNKTVLVKYVGDSVNLTCHLEHQSNLSSHGKFVSNDFSDAFVHTLNWIIPNNGEDRVIIAEYKDRVTINIEDLQETDYGNYTCVLLPEEASAFSSKEAYIYLAVLPRGQVSHCEDNSFFCEKSLCIPQRYLCDGHPDCPNGADESMENCGPDACRDKLLCDDGRCLSPAICCREDSRTPPNCTIHASIQCCRQLLHPALIDQDLFYMASRPKVKQVIPEERNTGLFIGGIIAVIIAAIGLTMRAQTLYCRSTGNSFTNWYRNSSFNIFASNPVDQYSLHSTSILNDRSPHPTLSLLQCQGSDIGNLVMISIPRALNNNSDHPHYRPPPSYNQAVNGPPPPYSSQMNEFESDASSIAINQSIFVPLLNSAQSFNDIFPVDDNNGEMNGNSSNFVEASHNPNYPQFTAYTRSSTQSTSVSIPINLSPRLSSSSPSTDFPFQDHINK